MAFELTPEEKRDDALYLAQAKKWAFYAHALYEKLVAPVASQLRGELLISPDGAIAYIPFEMLLCSVPEHPEAYKTHHYFIKDFPVSYTASAAMLQVMCQQSDGTRAPKPFWGLAPYFDPASMGAISQRSGQTRIDWQPLLYSGQEVKTLQKITGGSISLGKDATRKSFMEQAGQYRILHLSTHAQSNDANGDYSFILFSEGNEKAPEQAMMFVNEIYQLRLNADMVVLSACETGLGQIQGGEGVISLSRAFAYAGAASVMTSYWPVADRQTPVLMEAFYEQYYDGKLTKAKALQQAKLKYIQQSVRNDEAQPYFWAGFFLVGNTAAYR